MAQLEKRVIHTHPRDRRSYDYGKAGESSTAKERFMAFSNEASHRPIYAPQRTPKNRRISMTAVNFLIGQQGRK